MLVVTSAFPLILVGCSRSSGKQSSDNKDKGTTSIKHAMGTTETKGKSKCIVTLHQGATDAAVPLGIKPVGAVESWTQRPKFKYIRNDLKDTKIVGQEPAPNSEKISRLKPGLAVVSRVRSGKVYDQLSKIAPTVSIDTISKFKGTTKLMGKALGKEKEIEDLLKKYDDRVTAFQEDVKVKYKDAWPLKVSVVSFHADHTRIYVSEYTGEILNDLGFKRNKDLQRRADNDKNIIRLTSRESIPLTNADHIFVVKSDLNAKDAALAEKIESEWISSKEWKSLDAVRNNQVSDDLDEVTWNLVDGYKSSLKLTDDLCEKLDAERQSR